MQDAIYILKKLKQNNYQAYIVGGAVRDYLLKIKSNDIDITTNAKPEEVEKLFKKTIPTGIKFGTITVRLNNKSYEVTTFRKDSLYKDNRHPDKINYSSDVEEDVLRRDFTINGLLMDENYKIYDYTDGIKDLKTGVLRAIGDPNMRFKEDALRMLRLFYFVSKLNFEVEEDTLKAVKKNRKLIENISSERVYQELNKMITSTNTLKAFNLLVETNIYKNLIGLSKGIEIFVEKKIKPTKDLFFALSFYLNKKIPSYWKLSNNEKYLFIKVNEILKNNTKITNYLLYKYGLKPCLISADILNIINNQKIKKEDIILKYNNLPIKSLKDLDISSKRIIKLKNKETGPWLGKLLEQLVKNILDYKLKNNKKDLEEYIMKRK